MIRSPKLQAVGFDLVIEVNNIYCYDPDMIREHIVQAIIAFMRALPPGKPLMVSRLYPELCFGSLKNLRFRKPEHGQFPDSVEHKLYARPEDINIEVVN